MGEGAVAEVLDEVVDVDERGDADPLSTLATHLSVAHHLADAVGCHQPDQAMAADARADKCVGGCLGAGRVRAARAEVGRAVGEHLDLLADVQPGDRRPRGEPGRVDPPAQPAPERLDDRVGVEGSRAGQQDRTVGVALAHHAGRTGGAVERIAQLHLDERALLLDDDDLIEAIGEAPGDLVVERVDHAHLQEPDPVGAEPRLVEAEQLQCLEHLVVAPARRDDAEPRSRCVVGDPVQTVRRCVQAGEWETGLEDLLLDRARHPGPDLAADTAPVRRPVPLELGQHRADAARTDVDHRRAVGHRGDDLDAAPQADESRNGDAVQAEVEHLLHVAGVEDGQVEVGQRPLRRRRQRRRLARGVVACEREHAAEGVGARVLGVADGVAGPIDAG